MLEPKTLGAVLALEGLLGGVDFQVGHEVAFQSTFEGAEGALIDGFLEVLRSVGDEFGDLVGGGVA